MLDSIDNITKDIILERAKYYCHQIDFLATGKIEERQLDLPFIFDGDEFLITLFSKNPLTDFHIEFSSDSMDRMGKYEEDDADFLVLRLEIFSKDVSVGTTAVKVPYLEEGSFEVLDVFSVEDMGYCYYLHVNCNLSCYGTANVEREFAFDMFKELEGKYQTQLDNNLITSEVYRELKAEIDSNSIDTLKSFLLQVQGVPVLQYLVSIFKAMLADEEIEDKTEIVNYTQNRLIEIYNQLGDYDSFVDVCFNMKSAVKFITEFTGLTLEEMNQKYNLQIQDDENHSLTTEEIAGYRSALEDNEFNFTLYAEYLNYIYQLMDKMNQEYSMKTYQE